MSYILDALNKAEHERRLGDVPHLHAPARVAAQPTEAHTPRATMVLLVGLAALIVIAGLLIWLRPWASDSVYTLTIRTTKSDPALAATPAAPAVMRAAPPLLAPQETAIAQPAPAAPAGRPATAATRPATPPVAAPPVAAPATASVPVRPAATSSVAVPTVAAPPVVTPPVVTPPIASRPLTAPPAAAPRSSAETLPTLRDLPQNIQQQIPALTVSGYIYAEQPEDRSIIINSKFTREGEQIAPDLQLERLTPNGMILNFRGFRYRARY